MTWPTKRERRAALVAGLLGTASGLLLPAEAAQNVALLLNEVLKLFVSW